MLRDVSFRVEPGQRVAIVGATGSGKTTIVSLLLRFYDVQEGRITIDGVDIREMDPGSLRSLFALVLQDVHLFSGTIAGNIRLGHDSITDDAVRRAVKAVHADEFIDRLPPGLQTPVAERGATLSVGQKQLLSFARALAFDPRVLILDEATSSVDTETELLIRDALKVVMRGRTTIAIAHRLSTIRTWTASSWFTRASCASQGDHQQLLAQRGHLPPALPASVPGSGVGRLRPLTARLFRRRLFDRRGDGRGRRTSRRAPRGRLRCLPLAEQVVDEPWRARVRIPAEAQDRDAGGSAAELVPRLVAIPHVNVDVAALDGRARVHHRVDAVVALAQAIDLDDRTDRQQVRIGGGNPVSHVHARGGRRAPAVGGRSR